MSYRYEKTEEGVDLVISGFADGIADSALKGHQQMQNVDILTNPGAVMAGWASVLATATSTLVQWMKRDPVTGDVYGLTSAGVLHKLTGGTWSVVTGTPASNGTGLGIWKGYLLIAAGTAVQAAQLPVTNASSWNAVVGLTITSALWQPIFTNLNTDFCYIGHNYKLASIKEKVSQTFAPTNAVTFTPNAAALDIPSYFKIQTIEGLGNNLYLGTYQGTVDYDRMAAVIFPWDKVSDSYDNPIISSGTGVHQLKTIGSQMYTYIGNRSDISVSNGSTTSLLKKFYNIQFPNASTLTNINPDAIDALTNQEILIGIGRVGGNITPLGVYSLREGVHILRNLPSPGNKINIQIGSILALDAQRYLFSWFDNTTNSYGIDIVGNDGRYSDYSSIVETDLVPVSTSVYPQGFGQIEFKLGNLFSTGQGIKIGYRTSLEAVYTPINTWDFTTIGAKMSFVDNANINDAEWVQFEISIKGNGDTSPQLTEIRLRQ